MQDQENHISSLSSKGSHDSPGLDDGPKPRKPKLPPSEWAKEKLPEARSRKPQPPYAWYSRKPLEKLKDCPKVANFSRAVTVFLALIHHDEKGHGRTDHSFGFMAKFLGISRNTFRAGIADLEAAGIIHVCHRKGKYPAKDKPPIVTILPVRMHSKADTMMHSKKEGIHFEHNSRKDLKNPPAGAPDGFIQNPSSSIEDKEHSNPALQTGSLAPDGTRPDAAGGGGKERRPRLADMLRELKGA